MAISSTTFKKGQCGNPNKIGSGRKPATQEEVDLRNACKERTLDALNTIFEIMMNGEKEQSRLQAAIHILDRGWGKVKEIPDNPEDNKGETSLTKAEIEQILLKAINNNGVS